MLNKRWFIALIGLMCGIALGTMGIILVENPAQPTALLTKLQGKDGAPQIVGSTDLDKKSPGDQADPDAIGPAGDSHSQGEDDQESALDDPNSFAAQGVPADLAEEVIADYKLGVGTLFDAWKSPDLNAFRIKAEKAYVGDLLDKHVEKAKSFIDKGLGMSVTRITFDRVVVETASAETATLRADYRYTAEDYDVIAQKGVGSEHEQTVHVRANLIKTNSQWLITGETILE